MRNLFRLLLGLVLIVIVFFVGAYGYNFFFGKNKVAEEGVANETFGSVAFADFQGKYHTEGKETVNRQVNLERKVNVDGNILELSGIQLYTHQQVLYSDTSGRRAGGKWQEEGKYKNKPVLIQGEFTEFAAAAADGGVVEGSLKRSTSYNGKKIEAQGSYREVAVPKNGVVVANGTYLEEIPFDDFSAHIRIDYSYEDAKQIDITWTRYIKLIKNGSATVYSSQGSYSGVKEHIFIAAAPYELLVLTAKGGF